MSDKNCPLCSQCAEPSLRDAKSGKFYCKCDVCDLWFLQASDHLSNEEARAHYDLHENDIEDPAYRAFVSPLFREITLRHAPQSKGLDFGAGPGPVLAAMLTEAGYHIDLYDPIYHPDATFSGRPYDFVVVCEVAEHFLQPLTEFQRLWDLVRPGGTVAVMTSLVTEHVRFADWYYRRDPTHVAFYSKDTFAWIQHTVGFSTLDTDGKKVAILQR